MSYNGFRKEERSRLSCDNQPFNLLNSGGQEALFPHDATFALSRGGAEAVPVADEARRKPGEEKQRLDDYYRTLYNNCRVRKIGKKL